MPTYWERQAEDNIQRGYTRYASRYRTSEAWSLHLALNLPVIVPVSTVSRTSLSSIRSVLAYTPAFCFKICQGQSAIVND